MKAIVPPKMKEISNCGQCSCFEIHDIDSNGRWIDGLTGIYCSKVDDYSESMVRYTNDGIVNKRIISTTDGSNDPRTNAKVPKWCPYLSSEDKKALESKEDKTKGIGKIKEDIGFVRKKIAANVS